MDDNLLMEKLTLLTRANHTWEGRRGPILPHWVEPCAEKLFLDWFDMISCCNQDYFQPICISKFCYQVSRLRFFCACWRSSKRLGAKEIRFELTANATILHTAVKNHKKAPTCWCPNPWRSSLWGRCEGCPCRRRPGGWRRGWQQWQGQCCRRQPKPRPTSCKYDTFGRLSTWQILHARRQKMLSQCIRIHTGLHLKHAGSARLKVKHGWSRQRVRSGCKACPISCWEPILRQRYVTPATNLTWQQRQ